MKFFLSGFLKEKDPGKLCPFFHFLFLALLLAFPYPEMADDETVVLQSQDGRDFSVIVKAAKMSETVKSLIEDAGVDQPIPLPNVEAAVLEKVVEYINYHVQHPTVVTEEKKDEQRTDNIIGWDLDFCKVAQEMLFKLILAANYLDIKDLLDVTCKTVANMIKGKTPSEICATFNIVDNFTDAEREQVRKENEWCEER